MASTAANKSVPAVEVHTFAESNDQPQPRSKWSFLWDTFDKSPAERKFLGKLDAAILTFASLGYLIKYLDQANINNAFVSGMQQDLGLYGNQLNYMQTLWTVGYVLGQIPSNIVLTRVRPSIWIPTMELTWTILTFAQSRCNTATQFYILRFFVGLAESGFYPGMQFLIGCWYRKDELGKRSCIFHVASAIATMFSGYLMAAVYHLEGVGGFRGWQWLFLVDGIISLPIALSGYFIVPDMPEDTRAFYLNAEERAFAIKRMDAEGRKGRGSYSIAKLRRIFGSWHIYALTLLYVCFNNGNAGAAPAMAQWLRHSTHPKYEIWQINVYPTTTSAVQIVTTLAYAWTSDSVLRGARWPAFLFGGTINIVCFASLAAWTIPVGWKWACFILMGAGAGLSGLAFAWAHEICADDREERALVTGTMNEMAYVLQAWLPLIVWQQIDAPQYQKGYITATALSGLMMATALVTRSLQQRESRRQISASQDDESDIVGEDSGSSAEVLVSRPKSIG